LKAQLDEVALSERLNLMIRSKINDLLDSLKRSIARVKVVSLIE
jgi:hypothetical protein